VRPLPLGVVALGGAAELGDEPRVAAEIVVAVVLASGHGDRRGGDVYR
jgi:hypothetical protein